MMHAAAPRPEYSQGHLELIPSPLRPNCPASERLFRWRGVNTPESPLLDDILLHTIAAQAAEASLKDTAGYGSGLRKFHLFCDIYNIPESERLPATYRVLFSFAMWVAAVPERIPNYMKEHTPLEPVSVATARKYLAAVRAWHIAQGWPPPLLEYQQCRINWSLRGLEHLQGASRRRPPRPPITLAMLRHMKTTLNMNSPFNACVWAAAACAFWGLMRFGEVSVASRADFSGTKHLKRSDATLHKDAEGRPAMVLLLPSAKTSKPGVPQTVVVVGQHDTCPITAVINLCAVVPATESDPLFSWRDKHGEIRPLTKNAAMERSNGAHQGGLAEWRLEQRVWPLI